MNIVFYHSSLKTGGAERVIANLSNAYSELHRVTIIIIDNGTIDYKINSSVKIIQLCGFRKTSSLYEAVTYNIELVSTLKRYLNQISPDIVVCFGVNQLLHSYLARKGMKYKIIGSERANPYADPCGLKWNIIKRYLFLKADGFVFQTNGSRKFYDKKDRKGIVIPNPIDNCFMQDKVPIEKRDKEVFYSVGRLSEAKNYDFLIEAFILFHRMHSNCKLVIYGEGRERKKLEEIILRGNANDYIFLLGKVDNMAEKMQNMRFFVLSSKREGMPNALLEAMASGVVCISTKCNFGPEDIIQSGKNGILVACDDVEEMVEALNQVYNNKELQYKLSQNAKKIRASNCLTKIANMYMDYFRKVMKT